MSLRILIVDDDAIARDVLAAELVDSGHEVRAAKDGIEALDVLNKADVDLVVSDILMPNMDGYQLCRQMRQDQSLSHLPLIFYTGTYTENDDRNFALSIGASRFIIKPRGRDELLSVVEQVVQEAQNRPADQKHLDEAEPGYLRAYNSRLIAKLEDKVKEVSNLNQRLREEINQRRQAYDAIRRLAYYDWLTDLPNRTMLISELESALGEARSGSLRLALVMFDIVRFREINHTLGHDSGDLLLKKVVARLKTIIRHDEELVRLAGDEFVVLKRHLSQDSEAKEIAERALACLDEPVQVCGLNLQLEAACGIAIFPSDGDDVPTLLRHAEVALYQAKHRGHGVAFYDAVNDPYRPERLELIGGLRDAVELNQLVLHFQPKVDLRATKVVGVEALIRWEHPERGFLLPGAFIGLAEPTGLIGPMTDWIIDRLLRADLAWIFEDLRDGLSLNLSSRSLGAERLPSLIEKLIDAPPSFADRMTFEITESAIIEDPARAENHLLRLRAAGFKISIDDFGSGYSSLGYLKRLPLAELKIDRGFVTAMDSGSDDEKIVQSTIELAHNLGLEVIAEGVETSAVLEMLFQMGCDKAQGFYIAKPMPAADLVKWCRESEWAGN